MLEEIADFISTRQRFAITSHSRPDGDSLGSCLALAQALRKLGKEAQVFQADPPPHAYSRLPGVEQIRVGDRIEGAFDAVIILECNSLERPALGGMEGRFTINIDHHSEDGRFADLNWVDPSRSAVGEMVHQLILKLGIELDASIASNIYVAVSTDTGSFKFPNTNQETFRVASELVGAGADPGELARLVYLSQPRAKIELLARVLATLQIHHDRIASVLMTLEDLRETGASQSDTEGIVTQPLSIDGVWIAVFFRQQAEGDYRVSLRSKGSYDVAQVARKFGGGGHRNAAGLSAQGSFEQVRERILGELENLNP